MGNPLEQAMEQLQQMQAKMEQTRAALATKTIIESVGAVRVTVDGLGTVRNIELSEELLALGEREMLEDILVTVLNRALERARNEANADLGEATRGLMPNIPGLDL